MDVISKPIIVIICYLIGEMYKIITNKELLKYTPIIVTISGGIIGVVMYYFSPELINTSNLWYAIIEGLISGASATGTNQIIKQIFKTGDSNVGL